jgi:hypothetical protein
MTSQEAEMILLLAKTGEPSIPFGTAFQAARTLGRGDFQWQGKPYKAQTAEEARGQPRLPRGMKESDLYRDPAQEKISRDYYDRTQQIKKDYQQALRNISFDSTQSEKNALRQYTSDMAPFEQNQLAQQQLQSHMKGLRNYEMNELIQGTVNEEVERQRERDRQEIADLVRRVNDMNAEVSLQQLRDYEAAEQEADTQLNLQRLAPLRQQQALQPLYPEMLLPGLPRAVRGAVGLLDRLRGGRRAPAERQEPTFNLNSLMAP